MSLILIGLACGAVAVVTTKKLYDRRQGKKQLLLAVDEEERKKELLKGVSVTVFVRESNDHRTNLEHHVEQELISRGARVVMANQQVGMALVKGGVFKPLHPEAQISFVGRLRKQKYLSDKEKPEVHHQLSFRLIGRDGAVIASGTCDEYPNANLVSFEDTLRALAREAINHLDRVDVWSQLAIE